MRRNESLIHLAAFLLVLALCAALYAAFTDKRPGIRPLSADLKHRVSYGYLLKSAGDITKAENSEVVPGKSGYENGSANIVTSIVVDYRALDTLGEVLVLFAASAGVGLLMKSRKRKIGTTASPIVTTAVPMIMLFAVITGLYIILHGHLSPGGGFPGGAVIASAYMIQFLAFDKVFKGSLFKVLESLAGLGILAMGIIGLFYKGSFLANFLPTGEIGAVFSAAGIMILYGLIGLKVASELSAIIGHFIGEK